MEITHVGDLALSRRLERIEASQERQAGLIDFVACMADVDMPEDGAAEAAGEEATADGEDA